MRIPSATNQAMLQNEGLIPPVLTATTDPPSLRVKLISARPLYISTTRDALDVPRLSMSEPIPAMLEEQQGSCGYGGTGF
jgi:hypothetical protein